jgi:hypothetical protein
MYSLSRRCISLNGLFYCYYFNVLCTYPYRLLLYKSIRLMTHLSGGYNVGFIVGRSILAQLTGGARHAIQVQ